MLTSSKSGIISRLVGTGFAVPKSIKTASVNQADKPIYKKSLNKYLKFEKFLKSGLMVNLSSLSLN